MAQGMVLGCVLSAMGADGREGQEAPGARPDVKGVQTMIHEERSGEWSPGLNETEKETLFDIACDTLELCVLGKQEEFVLDKYALTPKLKVPMATFVTLKQGGMLRGCIGSLAPVAPLADSVHDNAVNAALRDHRFTPLKQQELGRTDVHVSILSPIEPLASLKDFKLGEHGIIIEKQGRRAVYLPEVAPEQGWTVEQTLSSLSRKAGLPADAWKEGARFKVFSSVVLSK